MPRFRFTVRRMMIVVAVVAVTLWGWRMRRLSTAYAERASAALADRDLWDRGIRMSEEKAAYWAASILKLRSGAAEIRAGSVKYPRDVKDQLEEIASSQEESAAFNSWLRDRETRYAERMRKYRDESEGLRRKYTRAARYPWLPVAPDPPESK